MTGSSDSTGQMTQSRTSYLATEIRWGYRFKTCLSYDYEHHAYVVQKELFNITEVVDTPLCSAHRLHQVMNDIDRLNNVTPNNSPVESPLTSPTEPDSGIHFEISSSINFEEMTETYV